MIPKMLVPPINKKIKQSRWEKKSKLHLYLSSLMFWSDIKNTQNISPIFCVFLFAKKKKCEKMSKLFELDSSLKVTFFFSAAASYFLEIWRTKKYFAIVWLNKHLFLLSMILHLFQQVVRQLCKMNTARHGMEQVGMGGFQTRRPPRSFGGK